MALRRFLALNYLSSRPPWALASLFRAVSGYRIAAGTACDGYWLRGAGYLDRSSSCKNDGAAGGNRESFTAMESQPIGWCRAWAGPPIGCSVLDCDQASPILRIKMKILYVADLHYTLKQFDWLLANAGPYDMDAIGGEL